MNVTDVKAKVKEIRATIGEYSLSDAPSLWDVHHTISSTVRPIIHDGKEADVLELVALLIVAQNALNDASKHNEKLRSAIQGVTYDHQIIHLTTEEN